MEKPRIGLVVKRVDNPSGTADLTAHAADVQAILTLGGEPVVILPVSTERRPARREAELPEAEKAGLVAQLEKCDGIWLQGGSYSDLYELFTARYAFEHDLPTLGICAGHQVMAQALGAELTETDPEHSHEAPTTAPVHMVRIEKGSKLAELTGTGKLFVNSRHKYAVAQAPKGMRVSAVAPDGVIEALEAPERTFYLSVQFHPEFLYADDPQIAGILRGFLAACGKRKEGSEKNN